MTVVSRRLWLVALTSVGLVATIVWLSSSVLAIVVGVLTIASVASVAIDAWMFSCSQVDHVAIEPDATRIQKLTVDLRHRN